MLDSTIADVNVTINSDKQGYKNPQNQEEEEVVFGSSNATIVASL